jgi:hypothetical protein
MSSKIHLILINGGRGGRIITMSGDFGESAPPQNDLGASPLNSLNLILMSSRRSDVIQKILVEEATHSSRHDHT